MLEDPLRNHHFQKETDHWLAKTVAVSLMAEVVWRLMLVVESDELVEKRNSLMMALQRIVELRI
jgi:hypothetical protein